MHRSTLDFCGTSCETLYPNTGYILQQDGATSHTSHATQNFLTSMNVTFINKNEWPPQSPDLNPMDYFVWNTLKEMVYAEQRQPFTEITLRRRIEDCWARIPIHQIRKAISSWRKRLRWVVEQDGGPIDHLNH